MGNPFGAETAMLERIQAQVAGAALVVSGAVVAGSLDVSEYLPAVFVQPGTSRITDTGDKGLVVVEEQIWQVGVGVKLIADRATMDTTYAAEAGAVLAAVIAALQGWTPGPGYRPLYYTGRDEPVIAPGYAEFPALFKTVTTLAGAAH